MKEVSIKLFNLSILILLIIYTAIYTMVNMGYYEYSKYQRKVLTEKQILKFEEDVRLGKEVDLENYYIEEDSINTRPKKLGLIISEKICDYVSRGVRKIFSMLNDSIN